MEDNGGKIINITFSLSEHPKRDLIDKLIEEAIKRALAEYLAESYDEENQHR